MLLKSYTKKIFRPDCNPRFLSIHCIAHLDQDIESALPYLNSQLGGFEYLNHPPAVTLKAQGKLITVHGREIAINALKDEEEADKILEWLKREINHAWDNRQNIEPSTQGIPKPKIIEILMLLPKSNCKACGEPTCMVFATRIAEGVKAADDCPEIETHNKQKLIEYMDQFQLE